ncbi:DUF1869 domain-containing protein [Enterobacteriaceae bacterium RIT691]|nr:DUF1869 domain-containing protein [Enterobacteriaceae bacterium RIT691]
MDIENKGYTLEVVNRASKEKQARVYLKPMSLYVPDIAVQAVNALVDNLTSKDDAPKGFIVTVTNNNNGVSVDKNLATLAELHDATLAADTVKDLINIVRGYDTDEDVNVCGW